MLSVQTLSVSTPESASASTAPTRDRLFVRALRALLLALLRARYRLRVVHADRVPARGAALLVHNHVSVIDWLLVAVACARVPRFVMHFRDYDRPGLRWFFDAFGAIPIATRREDPALLGRAYDAIDEALSRGELVALCPEGVMTPDGSMQPFRDGATRVVERRPVVVVPIGLRGLWGSLFSRAPGRKLFRRGRPRIEIVFGEPIAPGGVTTALLNERVERVATRQER
jgi:1-acyl-sn-glycerol-3-phosphate acyltransferase